VLWCILSGVTLHTMGEPQAWVPIGAAAVAIAGCIYRAVDHRRSQPA
jgi:hypothetical protein